MGEAGKERNLLDEFVGQKDRVKALQAAIASAKERNVPLPNMLLLGKPGQGKTTLAQLIAKEMDKHLVILHAASSVDRASIADKILEAEAGILFIDEIHALDRKLCEDLYTVIDSSQMTMFAEENITVNKTEFLYIPEELPEGEIWHGQGWYVVPVVVGQIQVPQSIELSGITIIGATTDESLLPPAFLSRLSALKVYLRDYDEVELGTIATLHADELGLTLQSKTALFLAQHSRSNPRRVKQLVERAGDRARKGKVSPEAAQEALTDLGVDRAGLEPPHRAMLGVLAEGGLSRTSLGQRLGIPPKNVDHYFGDLMSQGLVRIDRKHEITDKGRQVIT